MVTRSEIISRVAKRFPDLYVEDVRASVDVILDSVRDALADGRRIELRGLAALRSGIAEHGRGVIHAQETPFWSSRNTSRTSRPARLCRSA